MADKVSEEVTYTSSITMTSSSVVSSNLCQNGGLTNPCDVDDNPNLTLTNKPCHDEASHSDDLSNSFQEEVTAKLTEQQPNSEQTDSTSQCEYILRDEVDSDDNTDPLYDSLNQGVDSFTSYQIASSSLSRDDLPPDDFEYHLHQQMIPVFDPLTTVFEESPDENTPSITEHVIAPLVMPEPPVVVVVQEAEDDEEVELEQQFEGLVQNEGFEQHFEDGLVQDEGLVEDDEDQEQDGGFVDEDVDDEAKMAEDCRIIDDLAMLKNDHSPLDDEWHTVESVNVVGGDVCYGDELDDNLSDSCSDSDQEKKKKLVKRKKRTSVSSASESDSGAIKGSEVQSPEINNHLNGTTNGVSQMNYYNNLSRDYSSAEEKEIIETGISLKNLKEEYWLKTQTSANNSPAPNRKGYVDTGVSVKNIKSSFNADEGGDQLDGGVKVDTSKAMRQFSQDTESNSKSNVCRICNKTVFPMEKIKAEKGAFHKQCFRCKECGKQLNVDTYQSHEGVLFCKPHFKLLFQPKPKFEEDTGLVRPKRYELVIKENTPAELPADVVRSSDKSDYGLGELPSLKNVRGLFEGMDDHESSFGVNNSSLMDSPTKGSVKRSDSILSKMARFQNGDDKGGYEDYVDDSSSDQDDFADPEIAKEYRRREKMNGSEVDVYQNEEIVFNGMSELRGQWEDSAQTVMTKEERAKEVQDELNKLRQRICHGKQKNLKAMYENAVDQQHDGKSPKSPISEEDMSALIAERTRKMKEKFERGELDNELDEERNQSYLKERDEDLSIVKESAGTAVGARNMFKQMDANLSVTETSFTSVKKSPSAARCNWSNVTSPSANESGDSATIERDIVRSGDKQEDIHIDTVDLSTRFKFFENYHQDSSSKKPFQMTPPLETTSRSESPEPVGHLDESIVRSCDVTDEVPKTDTAKKMLSKFRELESQQNAQAPFVPKPLKRITPPREYTKETDDDNEVENEPRENGDIVRACDKLDDSELLMSAAEKARTLKEKFENWTCNDDVENQNRRNIDMGDFSDDYPSIDTTKNLKARFEALKEETNKEREKPKAKINRFIMENGVGYDMCNICNKRVYPLERIEAANLKVHRTCFRCSQCSCVLRMDNYTLTDGHLLCTPHFKQQFIARGSYDSESSANRSQWSGRSSVELVQQGLEPESPTANGSHSFDDYHVNGIET